MTGSKAVKPKGVAAKAVKLVKPKAVGSKAPSEYDEHCALVDWLNLNNIFFVHIPNEGRRSMSERSKLSKMGLKKGAPDFLIFGGLVNVAIEMKRVSKSRVSKDQIDFLERLSDLGWKTKISYGSEEAIGFLKTLSLTKRPIQRVSRLS